MSGSPPCRDEVAGEGWSDKGGWISGGTHDRDPTKAEVLWPDRCWGIPLGCERSLHSSRTKRTSPCLPPLIAPCEIRLESLSFLFSYNVIESYKEPRESFRATKYLMQDLRGRRETGRSILSRLTDTSDLSDSFNWK